MHDEFGRDPSVQSMRRVFASLEKAQGDLLEKLNISHFDGRLRRVRNRSRLMFDRVWAVAAGRGLVRGEADAPVVYLHCLARAMSEAGIAVPDSELPSNDGIAKLIREVIP